MQFAVIFSVIGYTLYNNYPITLMSLIYRDKVNHTYILASMNSNNINKDIWRHLLVCEVQVPAPSV